MRKMEWKKFKEELKQEIRNMYIIMCEQEAENAWDIPWSAKRIAWKLSQETGFKQYRLKSIAYEVLRAEARELEDKALELYF